MLILKIIAGQFLAVSFGASVLAVLILFFIFYGNVRARLEDTLWLTKILNKEWYETYKKELDRSNYTVLRELPNSRFARWGDLEEKLWLIVRNCSFIGGVTSIVALVMGIGVGGVFAPLSVINFGIVAGGYIVACLWEEIFGNIDWLWFFKSIKDVLGYFLGETKQ